MAQTQIVRGVATTVSKAPHRIGVTYHNTEVASVERASNGMVARVTLNNGGYKTNTTKLRMNQFAAQFCNYQYGVYQKKGEWFVALKDSVTPISFGSGFCEFFIDADAVNWPKEGE